ncbi:hypothetical protein BCR42DRAFT_416576 [Absidia repens]|uniref:MHD domain-containing protein n=1 Tax=Absidia repens TaxID=90262 RepID=A0A1X2IG66_9FUNG|nr:hypothetical protein BCR42DRAFT_416576 [Absidia repens]
MNETASPTPYINAFSTERPKDSIDLMQTRLRSALKLNDELAEYFRERALVEDLYAKNLAKLNKKSFITDKLALGTMLPAWERIQNELLDTSNIHATFATKMIDDIEKSLRSAIVNDKTYAEVRSMDPTFQKLSKDYDDRQAKMNKHKKALDKPGKKPSDTEAKYTEIKKQFESTRSEWQQYSSKYIQLFQSVEEHHWYDIKNYLLQFETIQTDQMLKRVQLAGDNLASVSDFSVENEILSFCRQYARNNELPTKPTSIQHPPVAAMSSSSSIQQPMSPMNESSLLEPSSPAQSSFAAPSLLIDTSDHPVEPQSTKSSESYTSNRTTAATGTPSLLASGTESVHHSQSDINIQHRQNTPSIKSNKKSDKQRKFLSSFSLRLKPKSSSSSQFGHQLPDLPESADAQLSPAKSSSFTDNASVYSSHDDPSSVTTNETNQPTISSPNTLSPPTLRKASSFADSFFGTQPSSPHQQNTTSNILVDEEGFSIPPPDRTPWAASSSSATSPTSPTITSTSSDDQQDTGDLMSLDNSSLYGATPRIKLDIKNDSVIQEDAKTSQVALTRVASMLKETNPVASKRPRGRRELRSQLIQGNTLSVYQPSIASLAPSSPLSMSTTLDDSHPSANSPPPSDNNNSNESPKQTGLSPFAHDDDADASESTTPAPPTQIMDEPTAAVDGAESGPNVNVRITETIHAQLQQGQVHRLMVTGEVALLCERRDDISDSAPVQFILKPNGAEITHVEDGIQRLQQDDDGDNDDSEGMVYQFTPNDSNDYTTYLHYRQSKDLVAPLLAKPMWKCDPDQARLMIKYSSTTSALDQVMMMTQVGGDCHGAQSMPTGQWMVDQQRMVWSLGNNVTSQEQVIRAKFATVSQANPQQPIALRFEMNNQLVSNILVTSGSGQQQQQQQQQRWANIRQVEQHARSGKYIAEI